ncbi:general transcription factor IIH subunit TFB6 family [Aspergillus stella-maris]|uniref:general transcription factor IIH subunit TFB6 family n=1 Tax=Aspergillus stella-maris TaxID=1810926 RepID=UPI003CCD7F42
MSTSTTGGGFMQPPLSPAPSTSTVTPSILPKQRSHPLRAGSMKETAVINHVDKKILAINRRHAKKFSSVYEGLGVGGQSQGQGQVQVQVQRQSGIGIAHTGNETKDVEGERGYESFKEVAKDVEGIIDVLWVSGTPTLQIPYLISLSVLVNTYLPSYPFTPTSTFRLLRKLDSFFASLILGEDAETGKPLSGFEGGRILVSMTEKVRIKSICEAARVGVVEAMEKGDDDLDGEEDDDMDDDDSNFGDDDDMDLGGSGPSRWEMETARVYEKTIQLLGDELGTEVEYCDEDMAQGDAADNALGNENGDGIMCP